MLGQEVVVWVESLVDSLKFGLMDPIDWMLWVGWLHCTDGLSESKECSG